MNWIKTDERLPEHGQKVLGLILNKFLNAPWEWNSRLYVFEIREGREYWPEFQRPTMWCAIELPEIPQ